MTRDCSDGCLARHLKKSFRITFFFYYKQRNWAKKSKLSSDQKSSLFFCKNNRPTFVTLAPGLCALEQFLLHVTTLQFEQKYVFWLRKMKSICTQMSFALSKPRQHTVPLCSGASWSGQFRMEMILEVEVRGISTTNRVDSAPMTWDGENKRFLPPTGGLVSIRSISTWFRAYISISQWIDGKHHSKCW